MSRDDFWSRRKAAVEAEDAALQKQDVEVAREADAAEKSDEDLLEELGLPDPESLSEGDDFSAFMSSAVPTRLRNRALRRLWATNPVLANIDGLVEYGEDYTDAATVIENAAKAKSNAATATGLASVIASVIASGVTVTADNRRRNQRGCRPSVHSVFVRLANHIAKSERQHRLLMERA